MGILAKNNAGGVPGAIDDQTSILLDQLSALSEQLENVQSDLDFVKRRMQIEPIVITVCGSSELFAEANFSAGGEVGAGGSAGPGAELFGTGIKGELVGNVSATHSTGIAGSMGATFEVCVDLNELADAIEDKVDANQDLTDQEIFAIDLFNKFYSNSDAVQKRLLNMAESRLNAAEMIATSDNLDSLSLLSDQIDYLDQNISDATLLPIRIGIVASSGVLVPLPDQLQNRLTAPWGVVPTVSDLENSCDTLGSTLDTDICRDIADLGGVSLTTLNQGIVAVTGVVNNIAGGDEAGFVATEAGLTNGFQATQDGLSAGFTATEQGLNDGFEETNSLVSSTGSSITNAFNSAIGGIENLLDDIEDAIDSINPFSSGGGGGGGGSSPDCSSIFTADWLAGKC